MKLPPKFLIFATPRTGSTSLISLLGSLYKGQAGIIHTHVGEPFGNKNMKKWYSSVLSLMDAETQQKYKSRKKQNRIGGGLTDARRKPALLAVNTMHRSHIVNVLDTCYNVSWGIKHLYTHLSVYQNFHLLEYAMTRGYKIIFLTRNDGILKVLSTQLSSLTNLWSKQQLDTEGDLEIYPNIDVNLMKRRIQWNINDKKRYTQFISNYDMYPISYETIFCENKQLNEVHKLCDYLEIDKNIMSMDVFNRYMDYDSNKQNTAKTYNKIC